jgi:adenylate cyclase
MEFSKKFLACIIIFLSVSAILSALFIAGFLEKQSLKVSDLFYSEGKAFPEIVVIAIDDASINDIGRWPWSREIFASALDKIDAKVIGIDVSFFEKAVGDEKLDEILKNKTNVILVAECNKFSDEKCQNWMLPVFNATYAAANIYADDEIARAVPYDIDGLKSFSVLISEKYLNSEIKADKKILINYASPNSFKTISFKDIGNQSFESKIVLIGATAKDLHDEKLTPVSNKPVPGVEIHANAIQTILTKKFLHYQPDFSVIIMIILTSLLITLILYYLKLAYGIISAVLIAVIHVVIGVISFESGIIYNLLYPVLALIATAAAIIIAYYTIESKEKKWISELFGKYVSPSVANELIRKGKKAVHLEGIRKTITVLFADVRGFTSFSENNSPEEVVSLLNKYHGAMTDIIFKYNGTLDKYVGDEIMATYNVPLDMENHALAAVSTAIEMQKAAKKLGTKFRYGIGINTGMAIVGNIGSEKRLDYTVIGDTVNLGARLCSKAAGEQILISEAAYEVVKDKVKTNYIGEIEVKGKAKPLRVYEVVY